MLVWRICSNAVPTLENLARRNREIVPGCSACEADVESLKHVLLDCQEARLLGRYQCPFAIEIFVGREAFGGGYIRSSRRLAQKYRKILPCYAGLCGRIAANELWRGFFRMCSSVGDNLRGFYLIISRCNQMCCYSEKP
ncbi:hypothetical protein Salat_2103700 [Sesamum alatum]|uniref:Reverse transcriptase zinc-binding domain-containing protein n=1 Tax=Sesamum alatum TaxID=300844 RepID=A0AAE1Y1H9_9LAMI|nr:hypothetical protein Salat_2103700 [Sesamum alatum]